MKILVVDDSVPRTQRIHEYLVSSDAVSSDDIVVVTNAEDARDKLEQSRFDLLLLDIVLPSNALQRDASPQVSVDLLMEITETQNLIKPRHIVGITAFSAAADEVSRTFSDRSWTVLFADETSDDWLQNLLKCVEYIKREIEQPVDLVAEVDLLILTALRDPEMSAVHRLPWEWRAEEPLDDVTFFRRGSFSSGGRSFSVVSAVAPRMGMVPMALLAGKMFNEFRPRFAVMPGICAGIPGRVELGDVIFAELSWDYQSGKHYVDEEKVSAFLVDAYPVSASRALAARAEQLALDGAFWAQVATGWHERRHAPRLLMAPVASGAAVLADSSVTQKIVDQQRKVSGIEMEIYAMYMAAEYCSRPRPVVMGLKAVCDFADEHKNDGHQAFASYVSAQAMRAFFERNMCQLV